MIFFKKKASPCVGASVLSFCVTWISKQMGQIRHTSSSGIVLHLLILVKMKADFFLVIVALRLQTDAELSYQAGEPPAEWSWSHVGCFHGWRHRKHRRSHSELRPLLSLCILQNPCMARRSWTHLSTQGIWRKKTSLLKQSAIHKKWRHYWTDSGPHSFDFIHCYSL